MYKHFCVILQDVKEEDIRNAFSDAFDRMGIEPGSIIPNKLVDVREQVISLLFNKGNRSAN